VEFWVWTACATIACNWIFAANKMRFLDPARPGTKDVGKAFPLTFSSGPLHVFVDDKLLGVRGAQFAD